MIDLFLRLIISKAGKENFMGKKSRLKRERREAKKKAELKTSTNEFENSCNQLSLLFSKYSADDVLVSLSVSDLWIPNISSQVKHTLAYAVAISMPIESFTASLTINNYSSFQEFIEQVYEILPNFPMLEDYMPEADWGQIKYVLDDSLFHIFYGGSVERITDFISAFQLFYKSSDQALQDMRISLSAQSHVLINSENSEAGGISSGHIELPVELFWKTCQKALLLLSDKSELSELSKDLVVKLGDLSVPKQEMDFGDKVLTGKALPSSFVNVDDRYFPLSLRNSASIVIDYWANKPKNLPVETISDFISTRFPDVIKGPFRIITRNERLLHIYSALILGGKKPLFIIPLEESTLAQLPQIEKDLKRVIGSGEWAIHSLSSKEIIQIRSNDGNSSVLPKDLVILAVVSKVSTVAGVLQLPNTQAHVMPLPDFITIFDSIKDTNELHKFWEFVETNTSAMNGFIGPVDKFAAFRDSNALIVDGAVTPSMIMLDPHWGASWRYKMLTEYWDNAPPDFPDMRTDTVWRAERDHNNLYSLTAKRFPALSRSIVVKSCVTHFVLEFDAQSIEVENGRILELFIHCIADSINQRQEIISELPIFNYQQITMACRAQMDSLITIEGVDNSSQPLFSGWNIRVNKLSQRVHVEVEVNLQHVQKSLTNASDASFEVSSVLQWIKELSSNLKISTDKSIIKALADTRKRQARFTLSIEDRFVDVPDYAEPSIPCAEHYKIARRDLAFVFKEVGAEEGRYELAEAKVLIDQARDIFRNLVHDKIIKFDQANLVKFCIEQLDELTTKYDRKHKQIEMSLTHEVDYERTGDLAEAHEQFILNSRNYRYLIEACLSMQSSGKDKVSQEVIIQLVASIDWLLVLYNASDTLHNGLDVAGVELSHSFVPEVFYLEMNDQKQDDFSREMADLRLGADLLDMDKAHSIQPSDSEWSVLNQAFEKDTGISFIDFLATLEILSRWPSAIGTSDLHFSYSATKKEISDLLIITIKGMTQEKVDSVISLININPKGIRRLIGKSEDEIDVPLWEHNKRGNRYTIKPVIKDGKESFIWGAAMVKRASTIWIQTLTNGYMPADFDWPNVKKAVNKIKTSLEKKLETNTEVILLRATPYTKGGIDFMRHFRKEGFDDAGDYDGLAYWPETNTWVTVECKYNRPTFCLKDTRRLRDRIFDKTAKKAHLPKIERRREFLLTEMERIRSLLEWPDPINSNQPIVHELYVSRDIFWWMRNPPYPVPTEFLRIDALDNWLREKKLLLN